MGRMIDGDALAEWVHKNVPADTPDALITKSFVMAALATDSITPTMDDRFRLRKRGFWTEDEDPGQAYGSTWKCSNCGYSYHEQVPWKPWEAQWYFCPHCGSKNGANDEKHS